MIGELRKHLTSVLALIGMVLLAAGIAGYILNAQRFRFPLIEDPPFRLKAELPDAQAVIPGQGQTVRTAGVRIGDIGKVELEDGVAVVTLELLPRYEGYVRRDATALLRTKTGLKDMFIEVDPGSGPALREGDRLQVEATLPDVDPDEALSSLDADTRDYLKLLITGAGKGLRGRGTDLRETFARLGPLHRDLARLNTAVARRRHNLRRLVNRYGSLMTELGAKDRETVRLVRASEDALDAFASEDRNISEFVARLPAALRQTGSTLRKVDVLGGELGPAMQALRPPFRRLDETNAQVLPFAREAAPILRREVRPFTRVARPFVRDLGRGAAGLATAGPQLTTAFGKLNRLFNLGAFNSGGAEGLSGDLARDRRRDEGYLYWLAWTAQNTVSLFHTSDAMGPLRRFYLGGLNCTTLEDQGLPAPVADTLGEAGVCVPSGGGP
ncbi:MAG TPA: MlaD family protein [Thermoleophilaceae bacterium]|nr:MlaD family protein [Thermoleophilaceae bacterium]